jgi:hypothetical protein
VPNVARASFHSTCGVTSTPSGAARPAHSSGEPNAALSRASASTSATAASSSTPA